MLTKHKIVKPKKDVNKPFQKYFHMCGVFKIFFREKAPNFDMFSSVVFSSRIILKHLQRIKKDSGGSGACSPRKFLKFSIL